MSVDPLQHDYPIYTPYQYAGNQPITYIDIDGLEPGKLEAVGSRFGRKDWIESDKNSIEYKNYELYKKINHIKKVGDQHVVDKDAIWETTKSGSSYIHLDEYNMLVTNAETAIKAKPDYFDPDRKLDYSAKTARNISQNNAKRRAFEVIQKYEAAVEKGKTGAYIDISIGSAGLVLTGVLYFLTPETMGGSALLASASGAFSIDQITGGVRTLIDIDKGVFDPNKEYKYMKGKLMEVGGEKLGIVYNIVSLGVNYKNITEGTGLIKGDKLNNLLKEAYCANIFIETINAGSTAGSNTNAFINR